MSDVNISAATTTGLSSIRDYSVASRQTEAGETEIAVDFPNFTKYYGYYRSIPELKKAIDALAIWVIGQGYEADDQTKVILEHLQGAGKDGFMKILFNLFVTMKFNGDSFAQIIRESDVIVNLKPLSPDNVRMWYDPQGMITEYEHRQAGGDWTKIKKEDMFHLVNDRVANEPRGTSIIEACKWVIDARNEMLSDWRRLLHRSTIRIIEVDSDDEDKLAHLKTQYKTAIEKGEALIVPRGNIGFPEVTISNLNPLETIQYLENFFYVIAGIPKAIVNAEGFTEAASKTGWATFLPTYVREQTLLEADFWNQLDFRIEFNEAPSMMDNIKSDEMANTGQMGFQPNDTMMGSGAA